ncbi:MAG: hypothetical protein AB7V53_04960 [Dongiaceae bacterium]
MVKSSIPYLCRLLGAQDDVSVTTQITAKTDTDAILLGNTLMHDHPGCAGVEIRAGDRLVYMRRAEPAPIVPSAA